jgi:hypothetical protein
MKIAFDGIVTEKFESERGNTYISLVDVSTGGICKLTYQQSTVEVKSGDQIQVDLDVKPTNGKYGQQLTVVGGNLKRKGG